MRPFLLGNRQGFSGWSTNGRKVFTAATNMGQFIGRNHLAFNINGEKLDTEDSLSQTMRNFIKFANAFGQTTFKFNLAKPTTANGLRAFFSQVASEMRSISNGMRTSQKILDALGMFPIARPDGPDVINKYRFGIPVPIMHIAGLALGTDWNSIAVAQVPEQLIYSAQKLMSFFRHFSDVWVVVKKNTKFPDVNDKRRVDIVFDMLSAMGVKLSFMNSFRTMMKDRSASFKFPTTTVQYASFFEKYNAAKKLLDAYTPHFGFSESVVYTRSYGLISVGPFRRLFTPNLSNSAILRHVSLQELLDMVRDDRLTPLIDMANTQMKNVVFDIPIKISISQTNGPPGQGEWPFAYDGDKVMVQPLQLYYQFSKGAKREEAAANAFNLENPRFLVSHLPIMIRDITFPISLVKTTTVLVDQVKQVTEFPRVFRRAGGGAPRI
jgi:hypothetical protein